MRKCTLIHASHGGQFVRIRSVIIGDSRGKQLFIEFIMQCGYHNPMLDIFEYKVLSYIAILMKRRGFYALCVLMQ